MPIEEEQKKLEEMRRQWNMGFTVARHSIAEIEKNIADLKPDEYQWPKDKKQKRELAEKHLERLQKEQESAGLWQSYYNWCLLNKAICFPRFLPDAGLMFQGNAIVELHTLSEDDQEKLRAYIKWVNKQAEIIGRNIDTVKEALNEK